MTLILLSIVSKILMEPEIDIHNWMEQIIIFHNYLQKEILSNFDDFLTYS